MNHPNFQKNKVERILLSQGQEFSFNRPGKNEFGEPTGTAETVRIKGVYHESIGYVTRTSSEGSRVRSKPSPMILTLWEEGSKIKLNDSLLLQGKEYKVVDVKDIGESKIAVDISLEVVQASA